MGNKPVKATSSQSGNTAPPSKKDKEEAPTPVAPSTTITTPSATTTTTATATSEKKDAAVGEEDEMHPSWNDETLFSLNPGAQKVTKDDFELLTVIGKGSFGKVKNL